MTLIRKIGTAWNNKKEVTLLAYLQLRLSKNGGGKYIAFYLAQPIHYNFVKQLISELKENKYKVYIFVNDTSHEGFQGLIENGVNLLNGFILKRLPFKLVITPASGFGRSSFCHPKSYIAHFFHSLVSAHVVYKHLSFTGYDFIFCAGPHHVEEIKALFPLNKKTQYLVNYGYEITDRLMDVQKRNTPKPKTQKTVLFGPSWGEHNSLRKHGIHIIEILLHQNYRVVLRPHPISFTKDADVIREIKEKFDAHPDFELDQSVDSTDVLLNADVMISDYSGVAFEYALALLKPVIFMNGLRKQNNENWQTYLDREGIEVIYRDRIGYILDDLSELEEKVKLAILEQNLWEEKIKHVRKELLYNEGNCTKVALEAIDQIYAQNFDNFTALCH